jgi:hypothetical protein
MKLANRLLQRATHLMAALLLGVAAVPGALANPDADPPGRVGRLADVMGQVWLFTPESGEWVNATRNRPLTAGDRLSTDAGARAEVRIGSTSLRLDSGSELEVLRLDDERIALQLHNGSVAARLRNREAAAEFDLKTAEGRFSTQRAGRYRFDRTDATSHLTVYNGQALYEGPRSALTVNSGQRAEFWIDTSDAAQYSITEPQRDAFSAWNGERDRSDDRSVSQRYVSPEMTGVEDLDRHGRWEQSPDYGSIWIPRTVAPGWAPYSSGHWAWVSPWGWTWVDDAPWGFAPFHYGRWVWYRDVWSWAPGTYVARPVYAPALVAWVGGPRVSVSVSIGGGFAGPSVGWFPLAPREVYVPSYRHSPGYVQNINITHVTNITNITNVVNAPVAQRDFSNRKFPHAVTVVPTSVMTGRQAVGPASAQLRDAPEVRELTREPGRHGALLAAPVAAPVALARGVDPRAGAAPGAANTTDANRAPPPPGRVNRPGQRNADYDRAVAPAAANPAAAAGNATPPAANPATVGAVRPAPATTAPTPAPAAAAVVTPSQPPQPSKRVLPARPVPEPAAQAVARPAPVPAPPMRGVPRSPPGQDGRSAGNAPGGPAPVQAVPRNPQVERSMPEKRHQAQPAVAAPPKPADAPSRARGEPREEQPERRQSPRDRNMTN